MFEKEDWESFRTIEGLCRKAGVSRDRLAALVAKELADNALDVCGNCRIGELGNDGFFVQDDGPGIDPAEVADLFSVRRPLRSTKLLRLPSRGALGNGLRVVAGAVLATDGDLIVSTQGHTLRLKPQHDGTTTAEVLGDYGGQGLRVEVHLGNDAGPVDLSWATEAMLFRRGEEYKRKTSPHWYTSTDFHELCLAAKDMTVQDLVSLFDGCSRKIKELTEGFKGRQAANLVAEEARTLLARMKAASNPVNPKRLGYVGELDDRIKFLSPTYAIAADDFRLTSKDETIRIPYVVEAWVIKTKTDSIRMWVNRTPITGQMLIFREKNELTIGGCNLYYNFERIGKENFWIWVNIITPYVPITTDGKSPDLKYFYSGIDKAVGSAIRKAKKKTATEGRDSQKTVVERHLLECIKKVSGNGRYRYSLRQLFYAVRPYVMEELKENLEFGYFSSKIITPYESMLGHDLPGMYRDDRGTVYHPHIHQDIPLGTRSVEAYEHPEWTFNKVLYIEKEGFFETLKDEGWPEKHDCMLLTSKGQATRAAKDLIDLLGDSDEELLFYCVHDADAAGTKIYEALQEATAARPKRRVEIINLGLEPREGLDVGLDVEETEAPKVRKSVASYVEPECEEWLQTHRIELNAMTTPQFLEWLDAKMEEYGQGKLIPPSEVMAKELEENLRDELKEKITDEILKSQDVDGKVERAYESAKPDLDKALESLEDTVETELEEDPGLWWKEPVKRTARELAEAVTRTRGTIWMNRRC